MAPFGVVDDLAIAKVVGDPQGLLAQVVVWIDHRDPVGQGGDDVGIARRIGEGRAVAPFVVFPAAQVFGEGRAHHFQRHAGSGMGLNGLPHLEKSRAFRV